MGKVFTVPQIEDKKVPSIGAFQDVISFLKMTAKNNESVWGVVVCGSCARGDSSLRSDLDCFILYDTDFEDEAFLYMQSVVQYAENINVPLSFITFDTQMLDSNLHHVGPLFHQHLLDSLAYGDIYKGRVALSMISPNVSELEEVSNYVRHKLYKLQSSFSGINAMSEEERVLCLQKFLEAPIHVARKILLLRDKKLLRGNDSKSRVLTEYIKHMPQEMSVQLEELVSLDNQYMRVALEHSHFFVKQKYLDSLNLIQSQILKVIKFVRSNAIYLDSL